MNKPNFLKIAQNITQEYIETYGMELVEIDEIDRMISEQLEHMYGHGWTDGYDGAKNDYEVDDG